MKVFDILNTIRNKGFNTRYSWDKDYGNGTSIWESGIYKSSRHRKPIGHIQIGLYNDNKEVIGATLSYYSNPREIYEIESLSDVEKYLEKFA